MYAQGKDSTSYVPDVRDMWSFWRYSPVSVFHFCCMIIDISYPFNNSQKALLGQCYNASRREDRDTLVQRNELSTYFVDSLR